MKNYAGGNDCKTKWTPKLPKWEWKTCPGNTPTLEGIKEAKRLLDVSRIRLILSILLEINWDWLVKKKRTNTCNKA